MHLSRFLALFAALMATASFAFGQIGTSTLTGRVVDPTGAVVPDVDVNVVQVETNFIFTTVTNQEGRYRVLSLQPGTYRLTFEASGFKRFVRDQIALRTGDTLPIDVVLQIGNVAESIEVTAAPPLLETETSATGTVVEGDMLYRLPLYQRYINSTLNLVPGMTTNGYAYGGSLGNYHLAGQRSGAIGIFEDGVSGNDQLSGTGTVKPIQNSVAEVKVLTTALPAEYGHSAGGVVSVVKKSGGNEVHGLASFYGRSRRMQHRLFFDKDRTSQRTANSPNGVQTFFFQPDANVGGPVVLPKLYNGRNRTFFFFGYQKLIEKKIAQVLANTPTDAMKAGDFSFGGVGQQLFDPVTTRQLANGAWARDPFPGNRVPLSRFDPVARRVLDIDPWVAPNLPGTFNATGPVGNLNANEYARVFFEDYSGRLDHQFNSNFKIYGSYTYNHQNGIGRPINVRNNDFDGAQGNEAPFTQQNYSLGKTWVIGPTTINDARFGYFRRRNDRFVPSFNKDYGQILGIPNISPALLPSLGSGNRDSADSLYGLTGAGPNRQIGETLSFRNDLTKIHGTHAFKMGYEVLRFRLNSTTTNIPSGAFRFDQMTAGLQPNGQPVPRTGNTMAGFLVGYVRQAQFDLELASWLPRSSIHSFYFQDDWKASPTLTLNLGVRYSNESPFNTKYGYMSNFDPSATDSLTGRPGAIVHPGSGLNRRDNNNFQPRIGVAWHPVSKWVFRGGLAVNTVDVKFPSSRMQFDEYVAQANQQRAPGDPRPLYPISRGPDPVVFNIQGNGTSPFIGTNFGSRNVQWWDQNMRNPYVLNWNASTQYEINSNYLLEAMYQASSGVGLLERWQANTFPLDIAGGNLALRDQIFAASQNFRPYPHVGSLLMRSNFGHSSFHSGTIKLEKRYSRGLIFNTFYTFSKAISSQDTDNEGSGVAPLENRSLEKGRSDYDRNHRFIGVVTYELPVGRGRKWMNRGGILNLLFGGYELSWIQTVESGNPLTFSFANSPHNYYPTFAGDRRPDVVGSPQLRDNWRDLGGDRFNLQNINPIIDIGHFAYPAAFTPGNSGRNIVTGTPLIWSQISAAKNFPIGERFKFQLRWDFQNALKTYNFNPPSTTVDFQNPRTFGKVSSDPRTASLGGQPLMNLTLQLTW